MNATGTALLSFSNVIADVISIIKYRYVDRRYYPLFYFFWLGSINEIINTFLIKHKSTTIVNSNIYVLLEFFLLLWFLYNFDSSRLKLMSKALAGFLLLCWNVEAFYIKTPWEFLVFFRILDSYTIVLLSLYVLNLQLMNSIKDVAFRSNVLLCSAFIVYFSYKSFVYTFWAYGENSGDKSFLLKLFSIIVYINLVTNLLYGLAVIWLPKKKGFILR
jgi:hypothetical protein